MTISNEHPFKADEDLAETATVAGRRRKAREITLQTLYAVELSGNSVEKAISDVLAFHDEPEDVKDFAREMVEKTYGNRAELDEYIRHHTKNWAFDRLTVIDRLIMRLAICEFLYFYEIPPKVSIDEAIELTKVYSTEKSGRFVNGILDAVLLELRKNNQLVKTGRGLLETPRKRRDPKN